LARFLKGIWGGVERLYEVLTQLFRSPPPRQVEDTTGSYSPCLLLLSEDSCRAPKAYVADPLIHSASLRFLSPPPNEAGHWSFPHLMRHKLYPSRPEESTPSASSSVSGTPPSLFSSFSTTSCLSGIFWNFFVYFVCEGLVVGCLH